MSEIFHVDLEEGALSDFSSTVTDGGDLSAAGAAALVGAYGLSCLIDDTTAIYGAKTFTQITSTSFRYRVYIDINGLTMAGGDSFVFAAISDSGNNRSRLQLRYSGGNYQIRLLVRNDSFGTDASGWYTVTDDVHYVEALVEYASGDTANDGQGTLWIDGTQQEVVTGIDLYDLSKPDEARIGATESVDSGTSGTLYLDDFIFRDDSTEIGAATTTEEVGLTLNRVATVAPAAGATAGADETFDRVMAITPVVPTEYYIDSSATDDTGDGSEGNPKKYIRSIAELGSLNPGDIIYLRGGADAGSRQSYTEADEITPTVAGTANAPITIRNYPGEFVEILSPGAGLDTFLFGHGVDYWTIDGEDEDYHILIDKELESQRALDIHGNGIVVRYCDITNANYDQLIRFHGVSGGTTAPSILEYCHIHYGYDTIGVSGGCNGIQIADQSDGVTIRYCTINAFAGSGIHVLTVGSTSADIFNVVVQYCTAYNGVERDADLCEAFFDAKTSDGAIVEYCTMYGFRKSSSNLGHAMRFINYTANSVVRYNVIYDTSGSPFKCEVGDSEFYHNLIDRMYDADAGGPDNRIIHLRGSGTHKVYNNTIIGNGDAGGRALLRTDQTCDVVLKNNIFDNTPSTNSLASSGSITATYNAYGSGATVHWPDSSNVVESDLDFVDEVNYDYRINDTSPCVNAGVSLGDPYTTNYHSSAPDMGYFEVTSIAYASALSLGRAAALALAAGGQAEGAATLARVVAVALAGDAQGQGAATLARAAVIALAGEAQAESALSLDRIPAIAPAGEAGAAGAISLARAGAITTARIVSIESALSLAKVIAATLAGDAQTEAGLTLAEIKALSADGGQGIEVDLTVALALAVSQAGDAQTDSALSLDRIPAISPAGDAQSEGSTALARGAAITPAAGADADGAIALGQAIAIAVQGGRDIQVVVVTLSLARSLAGSFAGDKIADRGIDLSQALAAGLSGAAAAEATAALNRVPALVPAGGADAGSGLNLDRQTAVTLIAIAGVAAGLEVGRVQALITAGARVGVVSSPPDNRIFTVGAEDRVFVVPAETRTFSVV